MCEGNPEKERKGTAEEGRADRAAPPSPGAGREEDETFWEKVRRGVIEGYQIAAEKTDTYARIAGRRLNIVGITRRIERYHADIGERVCDLLNENPEANLADDSLIKDLVGRVRSAEEELARKEAEIEEIRRESRATPEKGSEGKE
jgi:hypothetical protein